MQYINGHKSRLILIHSATPSLLVLQFEKKDLIVMKVLILACLVALALAKEKEEVSVFSETANSVSSSEETTTHINKQKIEKFKHQEQQQKEDESQDKIHPFFQSLPFIYPVAEPIPFTLFPQNVPLSAQPVMSPFVSPEIVQDPQNKETIFPKHKMMPFLKSPIAPFFDSQIMNFTDLEKLSLFMRLSLPQAWVPQVPQVPQMPRALPHIFSQTPTFPSQPLPPFFQSKVQAIPQQVMPTPQRYMSLQALHLNQQPLLDQTQQFSSMSLPFVPAYSFMMV